MRRHSCLVVGVGAEDGLGGALCKRFARSGELHVFAAGRTPARLDALVGRIRGDGGAATAVPTDTTREDDVLRLFDVAERETGGPPGVVLYNAGNNAFVDFRKTEAAFFEDMWRVACFGGFLVGREAARRMIPGGGTVIFTGASGSLRGRPGFAHFAAAKAGLRAIAQAMAREFGPQGLHVAHVIIDGGIDGERLKTLLPQFVAAKGEDGLLGLDAIAETYWQIHGQHRTAWTHEVDLRPFTEPF
jgi:NAD(P)-dependent dehydrogenase (short-subunit alcohol dehydrogenase family)